MTQPLSGTHAITIMTTSAIQGSGAGITPKKIEAAVYAYIRAKRALGETQANTAEIANVLKLNRRQVENAVSKMADKGVKVA
jgi:hypothetical protein